MGSMAHPTPEPDEVELDDVVADPAEARRRLARFAERKASGDVVTHSHEYVRQRLRKLGVPLDAEKPPTDRGPHRDR